MEQPDLWFVHSLAAARIVLAFWASLLALGCLRGDQATAARQIVLAALTLVATAWAGTRWKIGMSSGLAPHGLWLASGAIAFALMVAAIRRWMTQPTIRRDATENSQRAEPKRAASALPSVFALEFGAISLGLTAALLALLSILWPDMPQRWLARLVAGLNMATIGVIAGSLTVCALELTVASDAQELLRLHWRRLSALTLTSFLCQWLLSAVIVARLQPAETPQEAAAPVIYGFGLLVLGFIAWSVPRRMAQLAEGRTMQGQPSLAIASWIGLLCLLLAMWLPAAWPWNVLKL